MHHQLKLTSAMYKHTKFSQPGWFHVETCICSWAVIDQYIQLLPESLLSMQGDRLLIVFFHHVTIHITNVNYETFM